MKPCRQYRKPLALLAAGALDAVEAAAMAEHVHSCARCETYLESLSEICQQHRSAAASLEAALPGWLCWPGPQPATRPRLYWKFALGFASMIIAAFLLLRPRAPTPALSEPLASLSSARHMNYRLALNHSVEALDELLLAAGARPNEEIRVIPSMKRFEEDTYRASP